MLCEQLWASFPSAFSAFELAAVRDAEFGRDVRGDVVEGGHVQSDSQEATLRLPRCSSWRVACRPARRIRAGSGRAPASFLSRTDKVFGIDAWL